MGKKKPKEPPETPSIDRLRMELAREESRYRLRRALLNIAGILAVAAAVATLVATRLLIMLQVNGSSMAPTLQDGEILILRQTKDVGTGDIIGFHYGGEVLLKRIVACGGDLVEIDAQGVLWVNGTAVEEPYLAGQSLGKCDIQFPCQVPEGMYFVLGDNRAISLDSRLRTIGCVERSQIIGRALFRAWPSGRIGIMH